MNLSNANLSNAELLNADLSNTELTYKTLTTAAPSALLKADLKDANITATLELLDIVVDYSSILTGDLTLSVSDIGVLLKYCRSSVFNKCSCH